MIQKSLGKINWSLSAVQIERLIRGLNPWPSAYTYLSGKTLKIWKATVHPGNTDAAPGTVVKADKQSLVIQTGVDRLSLEEVQLEGKSVCRLLISYVDLQLKTERCLEQNSNKKEEFICHIIIGGTRLIS